MFESSFFDMFIIVTLLLPYLLMVAGFALVVVYVAYLFLQRTFSHGFHLTHRKAH